MIKSSVVALCVVFAAHVPAQDFAAVLGTARSLCAEQRWTAALASLEEARLAARAPAELDSLLVLLRQTADRLHELRQLELVVQARNAAWIVAKQRHGDGDDVEVATSLEQYAISLGIAGHPDVALPHFHTSLDMWTRLKGAEPNPLVAESLNSTGYCYLVLDRFREALPLFERAATMWQELFGDEPNVGSAQAINNMAVCLQNLGQLDAAVSKFEQSLAMRRLLAAGEDSLDVAIALDNLAGCLGQRGSLEDELRSRKQALEMFERLAQRRPNRGLATSLLNVARCSSSLGRHAEAVPLAERATSMLRVLSGNRPHPSVANALRVLGAYRRGVGDAAGAESALAEAVAIDESVGATGTKDHIEARTSLALLLIAGEQPAVALRHAQAAYEESRVSRAEDADSLRHRAEKVLGRCLHSLGRYDDALPYFERAVQQVREHPAASPDLLGGSISDLAECHIGRGAFEVALELDHEALALLEGRLGKADDLRVAKVLSSIGWCHLNLGNADEALPKCEAALAMSLRLAGGSPTRRVASDHNNLALCLQDLGRLEEALPMFGRAAAIARELEDSAELSTFVNNTASCLRMLGRPAEAVAPYRDALAMDRRLFDGVDSLKLATTMTNLGGCLQQSGETREAIEVLRESEAMYRRLVTSGLHPNLATNHAVLAGALAAAGRHDEAIAHSRTALALRLQLFGDADHPDVAEAENYLARSLIVAGRPAEAQPHAARAVAMIERLRDISRTSADLRQSMFDGMKAGGAFELLQTLLVRHGQPAEALLVAERGRNRGLLALLCHAPAEFRATASLYPY